MAASQAALRQGEALGWKGLRFLKTSSLVVLMSSVREAAASIIACAELAGIEKQMAVEYHFRLKICGSSIVQLAIEANIVARIDRHQHVNIL